MTTSDQKPKETAEEFMSRWSRRKQQVREEVRNPPPAKALTPATAAEAPVLQPVEQLGMDSDYRGFFHPKVDEALRRTALKKLFSDPHFNIMDGLDTYIDDYSISEPLTAAMVGELRQAQNILAWASETDEEMAARRKLQDAGPTHLSEASEDAAPAVAAPEPRPGIAAVPEPKVAETAASEKADAAAQTPEPRLPDDGSQNA